jgi:hypothetical protein
MDRLKKLTTPAEFVELLNNLDATITTPDTVADLPPEFCTYRDEGCELAAACLECPLPQCVLDLPWGRVRVNKSQRDQEIRFLYTQAKMSIAALAQKFQITERTVQRALREDPRK